MPMSIRVTVWNEFRHEKNHDGVKAVYPDGIHKVIADALNTNSGIKAATATLDEPQHGLTDKVLAKTDVLIWWGHMAHDDVKDEIAEKVKKAVLNGMGLIVLHSGHFSKPFKLLMGTSCDLKWREANEKERLWVISPNHPIAEGIGEYIELPEEEMYGEFFDIPAPDELIFTSWFQGGEVFRSGCTFSRGHGKVFYFRPGHETHPTYHNLEIQKVIANAVRWAAPIKQVNPRAFGNRKPLENLSK
ncbi:MAG: ThuA domain-containing protein [bacterium]